MVCVSSILSRSRGRTACTVSKQCATCTLEPDLMELEHLHDGWSGRSMVRKCRAKLDLSLDQENTIKATNKQSLDQENTIKATNKQRQPTATTKPIATMKVANTNANKLMPAKTANHKKESKNKLVAADAAIKAVKQVKAGMDESLKEAVENNAKRQDLEALEAQLETQNGS